MSHFISWLFWSSCQEHSLPFLFLFSGFPFFLWPPVFQKKIRFLIDSPSYPRSSRLKITFCYFWKIQETLIFFNPDSTLDSEKPFSSTRNFLSSVSSGLFHLSYWKLFYLWNFVRVRKGLLYSKHPKFSPWGTIPWLLQKWNPLVSRIFSFSRCSCFHFQDVRWPSLLICVPWSVYRQ